MSEIPKELLEILKLVFPGLVAAWTFFGLTTYKKPGEFERLAQALVFTALLESLSRVSIWLAQQVGLHWRPLLPSIDARALSALLAIPFGAALAYMANNDTVHSVLRRARVTSKTGRPDQWDAAFRRRPGYVILTLKDERQVVGWPDEWPDRSDEGHFILLAYEWRDLAGKLLPNPNAGTLLIPASEVFMVEIGKENQEDEEGHDRRSQAADGGRSSNFEGSRPDATNPPGEAPSPDTSSAETEEVAIASTEP